MLTLKVETRKNTGTSFSRRLRINNQFPGIVYGNNKSSILLILDHNIISNLQNKVEFYQDNITLLIEEKKYIVKVYKIQRHVFKSKLLHIDFIYV